MKDRITIRLTEEMAEWLLLQSQSVSSGIAGIIRELIKAEIAKKDNGAN
jgi:predicted DNA-binding protein